MMNNKGQTLVIFIILIPVIILLFALIISIGLIYVEKNKIEDNVYYAINYYLENKDNNNIDLKVKELINKNISDISIDINKSIDSIKITVNKKINQYELKITYIGLFDTKDIIKG